MKRLYVKNELSEGTAEMYLFGTIGDDLNCLDFVRELRELAETNDTICIHINSGGGSVFDGLAIYGALKNCKAQTIGKIDGLCASMATVVALAMNKLYMCNTAQFMTHKASGWANGSADELKTYASMMDNLENVIGDVYCGKTGLGLTEVKAKFLKSEDTWFTASQALDAKLIDGTYEMDGSDIVSVPVTGKTQREIIAFYNSHFQNSNTTTMKQFIMSAGQLAFLNLTPTSEPTAVSNALDGLIAKAGRVELLQAQVTEAVTAKTAAETELSTLRKAGKTVKVDAILAKALDVDKKITAQMRDTLRAQFLDNPEGLETLVNAMSPILSVTSNLQDGGTDKQFDGKTWDELDKAGKLDLLKAKNMDLFKAKYQEKFDKEYKA